VTNPQVVITYTVNTTGILIWLATPLTFGPSVAVGWTQGPEEKGENNNIIYRTTIFI